MPDDFTSFDSSQQLVGPPWFDNSARWIQAHSRGLLFAAVVFQLLVLISMIVIQSLPLAFGDRIWLRVLPVDPRDLFRGDYVVLRYDFSEVPPGGIPGVPAEPGWRRGSWNRDAWLEDRTVYVRLEPESDGKHYRSAGITLDRPTTGQYLKGKYSQAWGGNHLRFGIESFYVQEGEGKVLEQQRNRGQLSAEIALTSWGQAVLCTVK